MVKNNIGRTFGRLTIIENNVHWVHCRVNFMKNNMDISELLQWCNRIIDYDKQ